MDQRMRYTIAGLRVAAVAVMIVSTYVLWSIMLRLSWQVDFVIAIGAAFAFAYKFERGEHS